MEAIQKARKGRSASSDPPLTTNAGTAMKSSVAHTGRSEKRQAIDHMAHTAISENTMYAAWNGISRTSPKRSSKPASGHALPGGWEWPRRSTSSPRKTYFTSLGCSGSMSACCASVR